MAVVGLLLIGKGIRGMRASCGVTEAWNLGASWAVRMCFVILTFFLASLVLSKALYPTNPLQQKGYTHVKPCFVFDTLGFRG